MARRLAAILAADVVGYSRLMEANEVGTLAAVRRVREAVVQPKVAEHGGRIVKLMGDGLLVEFGSVVDAVACAVAIQETQVGAANVPEISSSMLLRIGVNLGDVIVEDDDLYGDGAISPPASRASQSRAELSSRRRSTTMSAGDSISRSKI
ncbi:MAG TPA: hypothetical protein VLL72_01020 [Kiloniellales bacterium]|nr:hypothetical protein [Kiloniellales bacterium]